MYLCEMVPFGDTAQRAMSGRPFAGASAAPFGGAGMPRGGHEFSGFDGNSAVAKRMRNYPNELDAFGPNYEDQETTFDLGNSTVNIATTLVGTRSYGNRLSISSPIMDGELVFLLDPAGAQLAEANARATLRAEVSLHMLNTILATDPTLVADSIAEKPDGSLMLDGSVVMRRLRRLGVMITRLAGAEAEGVVHAGGFRSETAMTMPKMPKATTLTAAGEATMRNLWPKASGGTRLFLMLCLVPKGAAGDGKACVADSILRAYPATLRYEDCVWQLVPWCEVTPVGHDRVRAEAHRRAAAPARGRGAPPAHAARAVHVKPDPTASLIYGSLTKGSALDGAGNNIDWTGSLMFVGTMMTVEERPVHSIHAEYVDSYSNAMVKRPVDFDRANVQACVGESMRAGVQLPLCTVALGNPAM